MLRFLDIEGNSQNFSIDAGPVLDNRGFNDELEDFLQFLNQPVNDETRAKLKNDTKVKTFDEVWSIRKNTMCNICFMSIIAPGITWCYYV